MVVLNAVNSRVMLDVDPEEPWTMVDNVRGNRVVAFSVYSTVTNGVAALTTPVHVLTPARTHGSHQGLGLGVWVRCARDARNAAEKGRARRKKSPQAGIATSPSTHTKRTLGRRHELQGFREVQR